MKHITSFFLIFLLSSLGYAQTTQQTTNVAARPAIGWDSLKSMVMYPEIARRAGVQGYSNVAVELDETGKVESVSLSGYGIFRSNIEDVIKKIKWHPEIKSGKAIRSTVVFELQFQLRNIQDMPKKRVLIIESDIPSFEKNR